MCLTVAQICPCYVDLSRETGGVSNIVRQICLLAAKKGIRTQLICGNRELGRRISDGGRSCQLGVEKLVLPQWRNALLGPTAALRTAIRQLPADAVVHVHTCFSAFTETAMGECSRQGRKFVFSPHGKLSPAMVRKSGAAKKMWWWAVARSVATDASVLAASSSEEVQCASRFVTDVPACVVPNGYTPASHPANSVAPTEPFVLYLGYLDPRKQPGLLIKAFARSAAYKTHRLLLAGPDAYGHRKVLAKLTGQLDSAGRIEFCGPAYGLAKQRLLENATCLCLPSTGEGQPVVLMEAVGAGTPVLFSRQCNSSFLAAEGAGLRLDSFDASTWASAIDEICVHTDARAEMARNCRRIAPEYTWDAVVRKWLALYESIAG